MEHRIPEQFVRREAWRQTWRTLAAFVPAGAILIWIVASRLDLPAWFAPGVGTVILLVILVQLPATARRSLRSYTLVLSNDAIAAHIAGVSNLEIARRDVAAIEERAGYGLLVRSRRGQLIGVPYELEGFDAVRDDLRSWHPIVAAPPKHVWLWSVLVGYGVLCAFGVLMVSNDALVVVTAGGLLIAALLWGVVVVWRNPAVTAEGRRKMLLAILPIAAIVARIVMVVRR